MSGGVWIDFVDAQEWERAEQLTDLLYRVMYRDYGVERDGAWREHEAGSLTAVALSADETLLGTARLLPGEGEPVRQVRQVAVEPDRRGSGVGSALMAAIEWRAAQEGANEVVLHARDSAIEFYRQQGYIVVSEVFVSELTGIPHQTMRKSLG
jgi:predicted GNAT family N-acyltransferase